MKLSVSILYLVGILASLTMVIRGFFVVPLVTAMIATLIGMALGLLFFLFFGPKEKKEPPSG